MIEEKSNSSLHDVCSQAVFDTNKFDAILSTNPSQINAFDINGDTPLHLIVRNGGDHRAAHHLLQKGADPNITSRRPQLCDDGKKLKFFTPIEEAYIKYLKDENKYPLLLLLIQKRPHKRHHVVNIIESYEASRDSTRAKLSKAKIDEVANRLTGYDVTSLFEVYKLRYQAHLMSVGGWAGSDRATGTGLYSILFDQLEVLTAIINQDVVKINAIRSRLSTPEQDFIEKLVGVNQYLVSMKVSKEERWHCILNIYLKLIWDKERLEGFFPEFYLALRIRFLLQLYFEVDFLPEFNSTGERDSFKNALKTEVILAAEAHRAYLDASVRRIIAYQQVEVVKGDLEEVGSTSALVVRPDKNLSLLDACVDNQYHKIVDLKDQQNIYFVTGHVTHAVYIDFTRDGDFFIRLDNLGDGTSFHETVVDLSEKRIKKAEKKRQLDPEHRRYIGHYRYPYALQCSVQDLKSSENEPEVKKYLKGVIEAISSMRNDAFCLLYANHPSLNATAGTPNLEAVSIAFFRKLSLDELQKRYPSKRIQTVGNCVVKNNQFGVHIRFQQLSPSKSNAFYRYFRGMELKCLELKVLPTDFTKSSTNTSSFFMLALDARSFFNGGEDLSSDVSSHHPKNLTVLQRQRTEKILKIEDMRGGVISGTQEEKLLEESTHTFESVSKICNMCGQFNDHVHSITKQQSFAQLQVMAETIKSIGRSDIKEDEQTHVAQSSSSSQLTTVPSPEPKKKDSHCSSYMAKRLTLFGAGIIGIGLCAAYKLAGGTSEDMTELAERVVETLGLSYGK